MYNGRKISIIVATDIYNGIGFKNALPWHIPEDLKWFREKTLGQIVIMGRNTAESIGKLLPGRHNVIITSTIPRDIIENSPKSSRPYSVYSNLEMALTALTTSESCKNQEIFIIGGAQLYRSSMEWVDTIYKTVVRGNYETDTKFEPKNTLRDWDVKTLMVHDDFRRAQFDRKIR